ncbi:MAG: family 43 glycosylhydrolase, partial [Lachnospiraceae bacterium]
MKNKSLRAKYLYRFVLPGALCAAISCTASIPAFADEIIVEDAALVTEADASDAVDVVVEDDDVIEIDTEAEDASAQKGTIAIEDSSELTDTDETADTPETPTRVSVHDPSIVKADGMYYVLGSHTASASSSDLIQWTQLNSDYGNPESTPFYGNLKETFEKPFQWAGYNDGDCVGGYAIWAPDAIWNPYYKWDDGSTGAYMLYCCTSSTWRRSCISYLVSKTFDGTYTYVDTIIYSGFTKTGAVDGNSSRNTKWDNDYLNLNTLLEKGSENGGIDEISDNWFDQTGDWNHLYAPNAIDPNLFFDASGEKLYMSYGSWSGGLFLLELDPATGEAIYPGVDSTDEVSGNFVDRYFGVHLAGGNHQSGEAPYIQYDPETGYYYLYETYGGLTAEGGYNMRLFRSENPTGPYVDAAGGNASESGENNDNYGIKLIGNYSFYDQIGKRAA